MSPTRSRGSEEAARDQLLAKGFQPGPMVNSKGIRRWWSLARDSDGRWCLVSVFDPIPESQRSVYDITREWSDDLASEHFPPLGLFNDVYDLVRAVISRPPTTTVVAQWDRRAVISYLDNLADAQRDELAEALASDEPEGWRTLEELRRYDLNLGVKGRHAEAVALLKSTAQRLWPQTMTAGRLTQFGKRHADEVFMVLPYHSWPAEAETTLKRIAADPETNTGDSLRALVTTRPFNLDSLT